MGLPARSKSYLESRKQRTFFFHLLALWQLRLVPVVVSANLTESELQEIIHLSQAVAIVSQSQVRLLSDSQDATDENPSDEALILFSSGSTAVPKGVVISHQALRSKIHSLSNHIDSDELIRTLCMMPTHFGHGIIGNSLVPLFLGKHLYIQPPLNIASARSFVDVLSENKISFFSSVPSLWRMILSGEAAVSLPSLKRIHTASAPLEVNLAKKIKDWCDSARFFNVFGTTETLSWIGAEEIIEPKDETRIHEQWGVRLRLDHSEDPNFGELVIETKDIFSYYLNSTDVDRKQTQQKFNTGDLAYQDANQDFVIKGRKDWIINVGGIKVSPEEIERALLKINFIKEACVFGIPDDFAGERVAAAIVLSEVKENAEQEVSDFISKHLSGHKLPVRFVFFEGELPKNERGKILRHAIRNRFLGKFS